MRRIPTEHSLSVEIGQPDGLSNIVWLTTSDEVDMTEYSLRVDVDQPDGLSDIVLLIMSD
jgi:hypothetical protein